MSFTAVGSFLETTTKSLTWHPAATGNILVVIAHSEESGKPVTALASSNATWTKIVVNQTTGSETVTESTAWLGVATSTSSATVSITTTAASGNLRVQAHEFSVTSGGSNVALDTFAVMDGDVTGNTTSWPPVTAGQGGGELLFGGERNLSGTASAGTTSGVTYHVDANGNGVAYDLSVSGTVTVGWADSDFRSVLAVLLYEQSAAAHEASASLTVTPSFSASPNAAHVRTASLTVTPVFTAAGAAARHRTASLTVTVSLAASASKAAGAPPGYPDGPLDLKLEINAGGWTDATADAWPDGSAYARVSSGRQPNASTADPVTVSPTLGNADGRYTPRLWSSPYYGTLRQNTPVRLSAASPDGSSYLRLVSSGDRAFANDTAALHVTGSLEARIELVLDDWRQTVIAAKWDGGGCWFWELLSSGKLRFAWFDSSVVFHQADSTLPLPYLPGIFAIRVTLDASAGNVAFYTSDGIDGTWAQLGDPVSPTGTATSLNTGASPLVVGWSANIDSSGGLGARVREFRLYNGIGGTMVADAAFSARAAGTTSWTDSAGLAWSLAGGAEVSARDWVAHTELSGLTGAWHTSGGVVRAQVSSGGLLRRVQQGRAAPLDSAIRRAFLRRPAATYPRGYWTMEDAGGLFGSAVGGAAAVASGGTGVSYASDSSFACSSPLPVLNGAQVRGRIAPYPPSDTVVCRFLVRPGALPASIPAGGVPLMHVSLSGGPVDALDVFIGSGYTLRYTGWSAASGFVFDSGEAAFAPSLLGVQGVPLWISMEFHPQDASNLNWGLWAMYPGAPTAFGVFGTVTGTAAGNAYAWVANSGGLLTDTVLGHVTFQSAWESLFDLQQPLRAWLGEAAGQRIARLCAEEGLPCRIVGAPDLTVPMGPQAPLALRQLLEECEATDGGILHDPAEALAVAYRTRRSMLSQQPALLLDYAAADLPGDIAPADGDSGLVNDFTAFSASGSSARAVLDDGSPMSVSPPPPLGTGTGRYAGSDRFSPATDGLLRDIAQVQLRAGTVDESRITGIAVSYGIPAFAPKVQAAGYVRPGDLVAVDSPPAWLPPDRIRQIAVGKTAVLGPGREVTYNCVPASPYDAWIWDDPELGRLDSDASSLAADVTAADTVLSVATAGDAPLWATSGIFPFDIRLGAERVTVTGISGSSSPQSFTVTRSVNGAVQAHPAGTPVRLWTRPAWALA